MLRAGKWAAWRACVNISQCGYIHVKIVVVLDMPCHLLLRRRYACLQMSLRALVPVIACLGRCLPGLDRLRGVFSPGVFAGKLPLGVAKFAASERPLTATLTLLSRKFGVFVSE